MTLDPMLIEILACPVDKGPLYYFEDEDSLYNPRLRRRYRITDGIPDMLIDDSEEVSETEHDRLLSKARDNRLRLNFDPTQPAGGERSGGGGGEVG
ncbi:MAG TPA: Trm112 family protein [Acidimicrobiales bacterium]|nr:Trm112 family protein [Acidimicrobiales bacterium]